MKRTVIGLLLAMAVLSGCGGPQKAQSAPVENAETRLEKLPSVLTYNDKQISFSKVALYHEKMASSAKWCPYMFVRFNIATLTEDERKYLSQDDMTVTAKYGSEQNELYAVSFPFVIKYYDGDELVYVFADIMQDKARRDLSDMYVIIDVSIVQNEKQDAEHHKKLNYECWINSGDSQRIEVKPSSEMRPSEEKQLLSGLTDKYI